MCTLVVLRRPDADWPLLVAANRDEAYARAWQRPDRHWPERPEVVAGFDELGGGSWLGVNDYGVVAAVANRAGTLGPRDGLRSRGELVPEALEHADAATAAAALADIEPRAYRAFNLFVGDPAAAYWVAHRADGAAGLDVREIPGGLRMLTAGELDDPADPRIARHRPRFEAAAVPDPGAGDWSAWQALLADRGHPDAEPAAAMSLDLEGFGTVCSHLVAIPRHPGPGSPPVFLFAAGAPDRTPFEEVPTRG